MLKPVQRKPAFRIEMSKDKTAELTGVSCPEWKPTAVAIESEVRGRRRKTRLRMFLRTPDEIDDIIASLERFKQMAFERFKHPRLRSKRRGCGNLLMLPPRKTKN